MIITREQYHEIREIVELFHEAVTAAVFGDDVLPEVIIQQLGERGVPLFPGVDLVERSAQLGILLSAMPDPEADMSYEEFTSRLRRRQTPLSVEEVRALDWVREQGARYCRGLGNRVSQQVEGLIVEASAERRDAIEQAIRDAVEEKVQWRETVDKIRTRIGRATGEWHRDLSRIASTESNNAVQQGRGAKIAGEHGPDARIAKRPNPDACEACKEFYLDRNGNPKIFPLSEIRFNTNARHPEEPWRHRKRKEWVPTLESLHPWCHCVTVRVPPGMGYNEGGQLVPFALLAGAYLETAQAAHEGT